MSVAPDIFDASGALPLRIFSYFFFFFVWGGGFVGGFFSFFCFFFLGGFLFLFVFFGGFFCVFFFWGFFFFCWPFFWVSFFFFFFWCFFFLGGWFFLVGFFPAELFMLPLVLPFLSIAPSRRKPPTATLSGRPPLIEFRCALLWCCRPSRSFFQLITPFSVSPPTKERQQCCERRTSG